MDSELRTVSRMALDSAALIDAYTDFILSRQALLLAENTIVFYRNTAGRFVEWMTDQGVASPQEAGARQVRAYLAELAGRGLSDGTVADHARGIRVMIRFWHAEGYLPAPVVFQIPKVAKKRLPPWTRRD